MIQELLGGVVEERKNIPNSSSPSQSATSSPSSSSAAEIAQNQLQNLRCPRCDSSNTKFCYYNNYNLTQPRHFCKTCRRYWTKGGALRNVPIGGGCRKARSCSAAAPAAAAAVPAAKPGGAHKSAGRQMASLCQLAEPGGSPVLWAAGVPQGSHLLALLRASQMQNQNPNPNPNPSFLNSSSRMKEEGAMVDANNLGLDHLGFPVGSFGSYPFQYLQPQQHQQQSLLLSDVPTSSGIQELYQRLRASTGAAGYCNGSDNLQMMNGSNVGCASSCSTSAAAASTAMATTTASVLEPIPLSVGDFGYWNPAMSWATDLSTANGAFP